MTARDFGVSTMNAKTGLGSASSSSASGSGVALVEAADDLQELLRGFDESNARRRLDAQAGGGGAFGVQRLRVGSNANGIDEVEHFDYDKLSGDTAR